MPVLVPRVRSVCPYTHTSCGRIFRRRTGLVAFSLIQSTNGHGPDQMVSQRELAHFDSANNVVDDLIQPEA